MYKILSGIIIIFILFLTLTACAPPARITSPTVQPVQTKVDSKLTRMLNYIPQSFLEEHDIWFGDPDRIKKLYGLEDLTCLEIMGQIPLEERRDVMNKIGMVPVPYFTNNYFQIAPLIGWDGFMIDCAIFHEVPPPWGFAVAEGNFDKSLIISKLTEHGYEKTEYGPHTYYWKNEDMGIDIMSEIGGQVLAQINRVAVLDGTIITAPSTGIMTDILNAITGNVTTIIETTACIAVTDSLKDAVGAVLIAPDRILQMTPTTEIPAFDLPAAASWGTLHEYSLFGMGYKDDGKERYWIISLYYDDKEAAASDADELVSRLESYVFNTQMKYIEDVPLTSKYEVGKPLVIVREHIDGAILRIVCRYLPETTGSSSLFTMVAQARDLLFLATEPSPYIVK